jgi:ABC-type sugar transport system permease subunit
MIEYFQLILTLGAALIVLLGILALLVRFALAPLLSLVAIPAYAAMVGLEYFIGQHSNGKCPAFLQFKRPKTFWKKLCMDFFASYCTLTGGVIASKIFAGITNKQFNDSGLTDLITHSSDAHQFTIIAMFWVFLVGAYAVSSLHGDDSNHPINKLEDLVIPDWAKKIIERATGK